MLAKRKAAPVVAQRKPLALPRRGASPSPTAVKADRPDPKDAPPAPLVPPACDGHKSGCLWCPLFPFAADFAAHKGDYKRDATKILAKVKDGHEVKHRRVQEPLTEVDILCVGGSPSNVEDRMNEPFRGRPGIMFRDALVEMTKLDPARIGYTNIVRCNKVRNGDPAKTEIASCAPALVDELATRRPKVLVAVGGKALEHLTSQTGVNNLNGTVLKCTLPGFEGIPVVACMTPGYVLMMDFELDRFCSALETAGRVLRGEWKALPGPGTYTVLDSLSKVRAQFAAFRRELVTPEATLKFDVETGALSPFDVKYPHLLCVNFTVKTGLGFTVPYDHQDSPFRVGGPRAHERADVANEICALLQSGAALVAQNEKFDRNHLRKALGVEFPPVVRDTMLTHLVLNERRGTHGLKTLAYAYTGMGGYEKPLEDYTKAHKEASVKLGGSYANIPGSILFPYGCQDTDVTGRVDEGLVREDEYVKLPRLRQLAEQFLPHLSLALADMEFEGAQIDRTVVRQLDAKYRASMADYDRQIQSLPKVRAYIASRVAAGAKGKGGATITFNPGSTKQLRAILFDYYGLPPLEMTNTGFEVLAARYKKKVEAAKTPKEKKAIDFAGVVKAAIANKEWEHFTTKADVLHEYERMGNDLAPLILKYRAVATLHGTFVEPLLLNCDRLGRVHGTFLIHGTVTGRLASKSPNLQNIPNKGDALVKRAYVSRFGSEGVLLQLDYSQIELRVAASWFNEPTMIKAYRQGVDLHYLTAIAISGLPKDKYDKLDDNEKKQWRTRAKRINFGVLYGGGASALVRTLKKDGVYITVDEAKKLIDDYFRARPALKRGIDALKAETAKKGYLESFTGRRRRVPEVFSSDEEIVARALRQSINFPIQSGASDMTLMSIILINRTLKAEGFRSKLILTVHDSIMFDCHVDEVFEVAKLAANIMENLPSLSDQVMPGIDWSWLKVPIKADADLGVSWGQLVEFDPHNYDVDEVWGRMEKKAAAPLPMDDAAVALFEESEDVEVAEEELAYV